MGGRFPERNKASGSLIQQLHCFGFSNFQFGPIIRDAGRKLVEPGRISDDPIRLTASPMESKA